MTPEQVTTVLESVIGLLALWTFVFLFWKDYCLDSFRQSVFELRDEMFLYAAQGHISFQHPAYKNLRDRMNAAIRYGHGFTLARFIVALAQVRRIPNDESAVWEKAIEDLSEDRRNVLNQFRSRFAFAALKYAILRSFSLAVFVSCLKVLSGLKGVLKRGNTEKLVIAVERVELETIEDAHRENHRDHSIAVSA
jgi:hypothetical protein